MRTDSARRVLLVIHPSPSGGTEGDCPGQTSSTLPEPRGYTLEHTTDATDAARACDVVGAHVVLAFAGGETSRVFHALLRERPAVGRLLVVSHAPLERVLEQVNETPAHYVLLAAPGGVLAQSELSTALGVVEQRVTVGATLRLPAYRSLSPQSLGRRRQLALLSEREREILWHLAKGARIVDIASRLHVSEHTVRNHIKAMFRKLDVHSQSELVALARTRSPSLRP